MKRMPLIASFLLFIALCASIAYWALQLFKPPLRPVAAPPRIAKVDVAPEAAAALFGGRPGKLAVASNYQLKGVIMSGTARDSVAILSADGKPAQAARVDMEVAPGVTIKEVHRDYVLLSEGGAIKRVELPENNKVQVNLASAAPVGTQGTTLPGAAPVRSQPSSPVTPQMSTTPNPAAAAQSPAMPTGRSPLLPPPASQAAPQAQTQTAPAIPPTVVVSPPPSSAQPAASAAAPAPTVTGVPATAPSTPAPVMPQANTSTITPSVPAPSRSSGSSGGELLPPSTLQSR